MTEADALELDPLAVRLPDIQQVRPVPENEDEMDRLRAATMVAPKSPSR